MQGFTRIATSRRILFAAAILASLWLAPPAHAQRQQKHKDPVLHQYLIQEFAALNAKVDQLGDRIAAAELEITKLKQGQTELTGEVRGTQTVVKTTDTSLSTFRLSTQQDLFSLKTDLTQLRQDIQRLTDLVRGASAPANPMPPPATPDAPVEGYVTTNPENNEVNISLGSSNGLREGSELDVFKANDPKTKVGILRVVQVLDANNSRARIIFLEDKAKLEFSDIVRRRS